MTQLHLRKVCRIQEITKFFTDKGLKTEYVYEKVIRPHFYIGRTTFFKYLKLPAEQALYQRHGVDYQAARWKGVNYLTLMDTMASKDLLELGLIHEVKR